MPRVLVTDDIDRDGIALLEAEPRLRVDEVPTLPPAILLERIGDYDAIVGRSATRISAEVLRAGRRLRVVGRAGVGVDNVAMDVATELGVAVINAPAGNTVAVAELFFGTVLAHLRELPRAFGAMREGRWDRGSFLGAELKGRTVGIVGLGRIGGEVALRAHAFGAPVVAYDPYVADARFQALRVRRAAALDELLEACDVLTVHTPLTDETRGMIGRRELARLGAGALVVNMARGGIVDEAALAAAVEGGHLRGAVLDVFVGEPPRPTTRSAPCPACCSPRTSAPTRPRRSATSRSTCARRCATRCSPASCRGR
jgi:D-3-phosphoglycerate dehydrogenase